ncbi:MAG: hypothetical protein HQK76_20800, partial [Desulfobacterales bacterium]|nr:hypothetical protein [Desulfobacterales bacterium]
LHEEWLRAQRTEVALKEKYKKQYITEKLAKESALRAIQQERQAKEQERQAKEQERQAKEQERQAKEQERQAKEQERQAKEQERQAKENIQRRSVLTLKKMGLSNDEIAQALNISLAEVETEII